MITRLDDFPSVVKQVERNTDDISELKSIRVDVISLLKHRDECDRMHLQHIEHNKKHDDSMDNLTRSNMVLAASISEMNLILSKFTKMVEDGQPVINFWNRVGIAFGVNKQIAMSIVAIAVGIAAITSVYNIFF